MRLLEYSIRRYGPLPDCGKVVLRDFNLLYGRNEDGKSLTIDALIKLLFGSKQSKEKYFTALNRVEEQPDGYVILQIGDREYKVPEQGLLPGLTELSPDECSNIFVIRNSDLTIANEETFYTGVTDRLTGLHTDTIERIIESLRSLGRITPTGMFRDVGDERLRTRIDQAGTLLGEIESFSKELHENNIEEVERNIVLFTEKIRSLASAIESMNSARMAERYQKGKAALERLAEAQHEVTGLARFNEQDAERWRDCERDIAGYRKQQEEMRAVLEREDNALQEMRRQVKEKERTVSRLEERKRFIDEKVRPKLITVEEQHSHIPKYATRQRFFSASAAVAGVLLILSFIGIFIQPGLFFYAVSIALFVILIVSGLFYYLSVRHQTRIHIELEKIVSSLARYDAGAVSLSEVQYTIQKFDDEYKEQSNELQGRRRELEITEHRINELSAKKIPDLERAIASKQREIDTIRHTGGEETLEAYLKKLKAKEQYAAITETQQVLLKNDFGMPEGRNEDPLPYWRRKVDELRAYEVTDADIGYDQVRMNTYQDEKKSAEEELKLLDQRRSAFAERLKEIERQANSVLGTDDYVYCKTSADLDMIKNLLGQFTGTHETTRSDALEAINIFEEIEVGERRKISELFGRSRPVSKYFSDITGGRYTEVAFNQESGSIEVTLANGSTLAAEKLSGGAYDQLYFSIRLALGEALLKGEKGFFILDDPFLKSDSERLGEQLSVLKDIARQGWQILYLSAKSEIFSVLENDIANGSVHLIDYRRK
jgi:DNA repair protein SbcC/Rad50